MKKIFALIFLLPSFLCHAEEGPDLAALKYPVKACLFKVEGNKLKKPSYLFGTIHLGDPRVLKLHPNAEAAFKASDTFYAEIDLDPGAQLQVAPLVMRKDAKKLTEAIGPELTNKLNKVLKDINPALSAAPFDALKTWAVAASLPLIESQLMGKAALDAALYQRAMKENKKTGALESADSQVAVFEKFTEQEQQILLDDRNIGMANKANEFMQAAPTKCHFFAVGAAHYTGKTAVQDLLEEKGYTITPLFE